ncbi:MAG: AEC family transporter [Candidatus Thorarchaeota archaeon]|jgi:predicted permease
MQIPNDLITSIGMFYVVIVLGYITSRAFHDAKKLSKNITSLIFNIMVPLLVFYTVLTASVESLAETPYVIIMALMIQLGGFAMMWLWLRMGRDEEKTKGPLLLCATFNNAIFLPLPLTLILIGETGVPIVAVFYITQLILLATLGSLLGSTYGSSDERLVSIVKRTMISPPFLSALIALVIFPFGFTFPAVVSTILSFNGIATTYLALFVVGLGIGSNLSLSALRSALRVFSIRQVVIPIMTLFLLQLVTLSDTTASVLFLEAMMPPAVLTVIFAGGFHLDAEIAASIVTVGTMLMLPVVPFLPFLFSLV